MAEAASKLSGAQRAAIFLLGVGEESAASIMRHMQPREVQRVGEAMSSLAGVSNDQVAQVLGEFNSSAGSINSIGIGASDFAKRVMVQALGEEKARSFMLRVMPGRDDSTRGIEALRWMDAASVADLIAEEHPQIIAIVLASLEDEQAAEVLAELPTQMRADVMLRVARLEVIDPSAMEELDQVLERQLGRATKTPPRVINGTSSAALIMNKVDANLEQEVMEGLRESDAAIADRVVDLMFVFEDLGDLDDRGMQRLIREISVETLVVALKGVDGDLQERFFGNMSARAADMLREDLDAKGPVKLAEVEAAQKEILDTAKKLGDQGELMIGKGGDDFV